MSIKSGGHCLVDERDSKLTLQSISSSAFLNLEIMSTHKVGSIEVLHQPTKRPDHGEPLSPSRVILKPGHQRTKKHRPIQVEIILERDQILTMRDGVTLRADIYRPVTDEKVPAIIMYGPYGKSASGMYFPKILCLQEAYLCFVIRVV